MEEYISKSAIVAEIERTQKILNLDDYGGRSVMAWSECFKNFIDTLEVKEVDLEKEFNNFLDSVEGVPRMWHSNEQMEWGKDIAKHFFEFGIKTRKEEVK